MTYSGPVVRFDENNIREVHRILGDFYHATEGGRDYNLEAIHHMADELNGSFDGFQISWHEFDE